MTLSKLTAAGMAALLVLSVFASMPVAAQEESVSVETLSPIKVTEDKAELEGNLTALANASEATVWFEYWPEGDSGNATATENLTVSGVGTFVIDAKDLESNTTYVAQAHAATENASDNGTQITFTTEAEAPLAVSTAAPTNVTDTSATFHGELTRLDGENSADVWFVYWPLSERGDADTTPNQTLDAPGPFNASVDDLEPGTTYFVQAHGEAGNETVAGAAVKFETQTGPLPLGVETEAASAVTNDSATLNGELTGLGGEDSADVWFEWWEQGDSANATATDNQSLDMPGAFNEDISGLDNDTTYVYVAHAAANNTTVAGDEVEFTTGADGEQATNRTWDGEGPFGQWVTSWLENLIDPGNNTILGQTVSDIVTANNPGSEHRSENANPGGNSSGPPDHAGPSDDANSTDDGDEGGPPEDAGPPDGNESDDDDDEDNGPPTDAGPPEDNDDDQSSSDGDDEKGDGPPDDTGPPADDEDEEDDDGDDEGDESDEQEDADGDDEEDESDEQEDAGSDDGEDEDEDDDEEDEDDDDGSNEGEGPPDEHPGQGNGG